MTKKKLIMKIAMTMMVAAIMIGVCVLRLRNAMQESRNAMLAEKAAVMEEIIGADNSVTVEYGAETIDLWSTVLTAKQSHPDFTIDYTVDGETELATFSTKDVGEHVIIYTFSMEDDYGQIVSDEKSVVYTVKDTQAPVITLADTEVTVYEGEAFDVSTLVESVVDVVDGELTPEITTDYTKNSSVGDYEVQISVTDCNGLSSKATATIHVVAKPQKTVVEASAAAPAATQSYDPSRIYIGSYTAVVYFSAEDQATTDAPDAAICYEQHGRTVVADHAYQGFNAIISNTSGVLLGSGIHRVSIHYGTASDDRTDIYYDDGGSLLANNDAPIVMYTCAGGEGRYAVTYWAYD